MKIDLFQYVKLSILDTAINIIIFHPFMWSSMVGTYMCKRVGERQSMNKVKIVLKSKYQHKGILTCKFHIKIQQQF